MRKLLFSFFLILIMSTQFSAKAVKAAPRAAIRLSPAQIIALINAYRSEFGLPAYTQNAILIQTAQGQADYQASIGSVTHEGPGGSRPRDRAYAAGYGNGEIVFISEIIYGATTAGPGTAVNWWKTSQIHNDTMLASTYQEIGAGVATANGRNYYTAVMGYEAGGVYKAPSSNDDESNQGDDFVAAPVIIPVVEATQQSDGRIIHIIRTGQTLWTLAAVYEVSLASILDLNNMPENAVVHPGDEILIKSGIAPSPSPEATEVSTISPTMTPVKESAIPPTVEATAITLPELDESNEVAVLNTRAANANIRLVISLALIFIVIVILATFFIKSPNSLTERDHNSVTNEKDKD